MMFSKETQKQIYKSILFDDLYIIQQLDKNLLKILSMGKKNR